MYIRYSALGQLLCIGSGATLLLMAVVTLFVSHHHGFGADDADIIISDRANASAAPPNTTASPSAAPVRCSNTQQGARVIVDDHGRLCERDSPLYDAATGCCNTTAARCGSQCDAQGCCAEYEHCVVCCLGDAQLHFDWCKNACRTAGWAATVPAGSRTNCYRGQPSPSPVVVRASPRPSEEMLEWR